MTRTIAGAMLTDIGQPTGTQVSLVELQFGSGTTRITTGATTVTWNGFTWTAVGGALTVPELADTMDDLGQGVPLELSGVDPALLAIILGETYRGRLCTVWHAHINTSGQVVADPLLMFSGYMNGAFSVAEDRPAEGGGSVTIATRVTSRFAEFTQARGFRCNVESHSAVLASLGLLGAGVRDTFFATVAGLPGRKIYWGTKAPLDLTKYGPNDFAGPSGPGGIRDAGTPGSGGGVMTFGGGQVPGGPGPSNPWGSHLLGSAAPGTAPSSGPGSGPTGGSIGRMP